MGNKQTKNHNRPDSLHPQEKRRLTHFLEENKSSTQFTFAEVQKLWRNILVPDLLVSYVDFIFQSGQTQKIELEEFITIYVQIIRGSPKEKANVITSIIGSEKNHEGKEIISHQKLCKYLSDLMESYFCGLNHRNDECYKSWTRTSEPKRTAIEGVIIGVCSDLQRKDDDIRLDVFEKWLHQCSLVNLLHSFVLGSMYNLAPEYEALMIPLAELPKMRHFTKYSMLLDVSQVVYLNSFLSSEYKEVWRLVFSIDTHGESFSKFVGCIVNQGPILFVVHTESKNTFGGFISTNVTLSPKWIGSERCFLFKIGSSVDVYLATGYNNHYAYLNSQQTTLPNGLGMGGQYGYWGLWIDSEFGTGECSESCTTYKNYKMMDSHKQFRIKNLEVWAVGEPPPTDQERGVRSTSALDRDPTSTHLLEMAGREMHSKDIREGMKKK